jgi:hypothetical protein
VAAKYLHVFKTEQLRRLPLIIGALVIVCGGAGYFLYQQVRGSKIRDPWSLIPRDALAVYEFDKECRSCREELRGSAVWDFIKHASGVGKSDDSLRLKLYSLLDKTNDLKVSLHQVKKDEFDLIYFINLSAIPEFTKVWQSRDYKLSERSFASVIVHEIRNKNISLSWAVIDGVWMGSFTPFLVEDVIRTSQNDDSGIFESIRSTNVLPAITGDAGNLYVQLSRLDELVSIFYPSKFPVNTSIGKSALLDVKVDGKNVILNGFSLDTASRSEYLLSLFKKQNATAFELKGLISNNAVAVSTFGVSDGKQFYSDLQQIRNNQRTGADSLKLILETAKVDAFKLYSSIGDECAIEFVQSVKKGKLSKVLIVESTDIKYWSSSLRSICEQNSNDSLTTEVYGENVIIEVPIFRLPQKLFYPLVTGFDEAFYTIIGNRILIGDNLQDLKRVLNDISSDETWGKSLRHNKFFEATLLESSVSTYFNVSKVMNYVTADMHPKWKKFFDEEKNLVKAFEMACFQFSHLNNSYYTNAVFETKDVASGADDKNDSRISVNFEVPIRSLHLVKSHVDRADEVLIQDSLDNLSLVSSDGSILWKVPVGGPIIGEVTQIDFFKNGKLQYFFATRSALHIIDRLGNYVSGYPLKVADSNLIFASVIDYDNSKNYRFLATDSTGSLWMFDKEGNNLEGWRPKFLTGNVSISPRHFRIKGKDYVATVVNNEMLVVLSRRGEMLKNFPLKLNTRIQGDYAFDSGSGPSDSYFTFISREGYKLKYNFEGKLVAKEPLIKNTINTSFRLIADKSLRSYLILQQDAKTCKLFSEDGKEVISNASIGDSPVQVSFAYNSDERNYISIADLTQGLTYIYDFNGTLVTDPPIESRDIVVKPTENKRYTLFHVLDKALTIENIQY